RAHLAAAARLAEDRDVAGIAAEAFHVVPYPLQRRDHVERAGIARLSESFATQIGEIEMPQDVEALVDGHDHHVVLRGEVGAVDPGRVGRPIAEAATVVPDHDGPLAAVPEAARPDVERQALLALRELVLCARQPAQLRPLPAGGWRLRGASGPVGGAAHA